MASPRQTAINRDLARALATAFDAIGPTNRAEAEEELRAAGVDPEAVGQRIEILARDLRNDHAEAVGRTSPRALSANARWLWATAAALVLCVVGWALTRDTGVPRVLEHYQERMQRTERAPHGRQLAGGPAARANHGPSSQSEADTQQPAPTAAALTSEAAAPAVPLLNVAPGGADESLPHPSVGLLSTQIPAGAVISSANLVGFGSSLSPGLQWVVRNGVQMRIADAQTVYLPRTYHQATEKYAGQVKLGPDGVSLQNYVAGLPFPAIDANDPQGAMKVMWNYEYGPFATDDLGTNHFELDGGTLGQNGAGMTIERHVVFEAFRRLYYTGRLFVAPRPELPNPNGIRFRENMKAIQEPSDMRGMGVTAVRYSDMRKPDDTWLYQPSVRRVRRLSPAQRGDALFGQDIDLDSLFGFNGQLGSMSWRLIGVGEALGCVHAENKPVQWGTGSGDFAFADVWEMRPVYVIEGTSKLADSGYSKRVLYIDQEAWVVLYADMYDRRGELWKVWLNMFNAPTTPAVDVPIDNPAAVIVDVQQRRATRMAFPNPLDAQSSGWAFNQGELGGVVEDWFTIPPVLTDH